MWTAPSRERVAAPLCHCLAAASVSPAVSVSTGTRGAALAVAFKMQMHFQMQSPSFFESVSCLSSCKCDFRLKFFLHGFPAWALRATCISQLIIPDAVHTHTIDVHLPDNCNLSTITGQSSKTSLEICQSHSHWSTWRTSTTPALRQVWI